MATHTKSQPNSGINRRWLLAGAAAGAMLPVAAGATPPTKKKRGIYADPAGTQKADLTDKVADFSYQNDVLAQLIVDIWLGVGGYANLVTPTASSTPPATSADYQMRSNRAQTALAARGIYLTYPIVITEDEYDDGFNLLDAGLPVIDGVVLVLPRKTRATTFASPPLLETAKMLMAVTPNGI
jgi:hypothetical protein